MKKLSRILLGAIACAVLVPTMMQAQPKIGDFGFGLILGEPTGITLKGSAGGDNAWDFAIGSSWFGSLRLHGDYLWNVDAFNSSKAGLYFGVGGAVGIGRGKGVIIRGNEGRWYYYEDDNAIALAGRVVGGFNTIPFNAPVEMFVEAAPIIGILPAQGVGVDVALGIRFYP